MRPEYRDTLYSELHLLSWVLTTPLDSFLVKCRVMKCAVGCITVYCVLPNSRDLLWVAEWTHPKGICFFFVLRRRYSAREQIQRLTKSKMPKKIYQIHRLVASCSPFQHIPREGCTFFLSQLEKRRQKQSEIANGPADWIFRSRARLQVDSISL